jgi:hypothetical protein
MFSGQAARCTQQLTGLLFMLYLQLLVSNFVQCTDCVSKLASSVQSLVCCAQDVGDEPYQASVMKITGNFFIVSCVETIAEGMTLAEKNGISRCIETEISPGQASCCMLMLLRASSCKFAIFLQAWAYHVWACQADCVAADLCCASHCAVGTRDFGFASSFCSYCSMLTCMGQCLPHLMFSPE